MDKRPIGMFDSGVGGITVLTEVIKLLPNEDIIYLGDTLRFPYGSKSKENIIELTKKWIEYLIQKNVKVIVIACGTATSQALEEVKDKYSIPIIGIINPAVEEIGERGYKKIGVMATTGTIRSNSWEEKIKENIPNAVIINKACPMLAPMAEEGWTQNEIAKLVISEYLKELKGKELDALILGCTHYPLFQKWIRKEMGEKIAILNTGEMISKKLKQLLQEHKIEKKEGRGEYSVYLTDTECSFVQVVNKLFEHTNISFDIKKVEE